VTSLGEFSPIVRLFYLGSLLKLSKVAQILGLCITTVQVTYVLILTKNGLGYILVDFFINSSGHPGHYINDMANFRLLD
jgi:hypothetical protein